jgi:hypothetical protein
MKAYMPNLQRLNELPNAYGGSEEPVEMNWEFSKDFDYMSYLLSLL